MGSLGLYFCVIVFTDANVGRALSLRQKWRLCAILQMISQNQMFIKFSILLFIGLCKSPSRHSSSKPSIIKNILLKRSILHADSVLIL